ncbi:MAG: ribosome small subunit-dependent GTPase A [Planctomycetaceae bacterium]|nr:ribosome small subunit-dependent GTPase A [Planctomycetaceae bacterium]
MKKKSSGKIRVDFRKNRLAKTRKTDVTREFNQEILNEDETLREERISGKGSMTRQRTILVETGNREDSSEDSDGELLLAVTADARPGLVIRVHGLNTFVEDEETGKIHVCAVRRLLKTLATDQRHVVVAGDRVLFRIASGNSLEGKLEKGAFVTEENAPESNSQDALPEGIIERIEPRRGCLSRTSWRRQHVIVANVDQLLIVTSLAEPTIKWNLIDRMIIMAEKANIRPIICVNKIDLGDPARLVPDLGVYGRMGYETILVSAKTGRGIERLRARVQQKGLRSVVAGQSGVGKSSLLNAIEEGLALKTSHVSEMNQKGRHTTTAAELIRLSSGGYVVDTPGIRSFDLWDVIPDEVCGFYRDIAPFTSLCRFQNCSHTHESSCAVREAVDDGMIDRRRFEMMLQIRDSRNLPEDWE